jgi:hypothetical protein
MQHFHMYGLEDWFVVHVQCKMFSFQINMVVIHSPTGSGNFQQKWFVVLLVTLELPAGVADDLELFVGQYLSQNCAVSSGILVIGRIGLRNQGVGLIGVRIVHCRF